MYGATLGNHRYNFSNLATLLAKASPLRSGDILAGIAAHNLVKNGLLRNLRSQICHCALCWKTISYQTNPTKSPAWVRRRDDADDALRSGPEHAGAFSEMVLAQGLGNEDRQASRDEEGDRGAGTSTGRTSLDHRNAVPRITS
jgi:hypothetical protein